jgi:hypothetical protein
MAAPHSNRQGEGSAKRLEEMQRTPAAPHHPQVDAEPSGSQLISGVLRAAIEKERATLFRAEAVAGCLRVSLNETFSPDAGEPQYSYVAGVIEKMIGDALEGLDQAMLDFREFDT